MMQFFCCIFLIFLGDTINLYLGHNLENIVYLELLRRGNQVDIGKADNTEIDFDDAYSIGTFLFR